MNNEFSYVANRCCKKHYQYVVSMEEADKLRQKCEKLKEENEKLKDELFQCKELLREITPIRAAVEQFHRNRLK